jgi:hypothetical protein
VRSATHSSLGRVAEGSRSTRSAGRGAASSGGADAVLRISLVLRSSRFSRSRRSRPTARGSRPGARGTGGWNGVGGTVRGLLCGNVGQLGAQLIMIPVNVAWAFGITYGLFRLVGRFIQLRVSPTWTRAPRRARVRRLVLPRPRLDGESHGARRLDRLAGEGDPRATRPDRSSIDSEAIVEETTRRVLALVASGGGRTR